jgi:hypothetical protein
MGYTSIDNVTFLRTLPSGKSFVVSYDGKEYVIPNFAVSDGSELWERSSEGETGTLAIEEKIAIEKGLIEGGGGTGIGIPLKRNRLPDPPGLMADKRLKAIETRLAACSASANGWRQNRLDPLYLSLRGTEEDTDGLLGSFESEIDALFAAHAPDDMTDLLYEVRVLREWVESALKTQQRRRRKT